MIPFQMFEGNEFWLLDEIGVVVQLTETQKRVR